MLNIDKIVKRLHEITADDLCTDDYIEVLKGMSWVCGFHCNACPYHRDEVQYIDEYGKHYCSREAKCSDGIKAWACSSDDLEDILNGDA